MLPKTKKGFTLIELLVVVAILSVLLVIVLVAINPARQTQKSRDVKRRADVLTILNAVNQYFVEEGKFPTGTPAEGSTDDVSQAGVGDSFCSDLVTEYVAALPVDPSENAGDSTDCQTSGWDTGYTITHLSGDRIKIAGVGELVSTISATR